MTETVLITGASQAIVHYHQRGFFLSQDGSDY